MPFGGALTMGLMSAGGSILGGLFGSSASSQMLKQLEKAQQFMQGQLQQGQQNYAPFVTGGQNAFTTLSSLLGTPGQGLLQNWNQQFTAPTAAQAAATPGYQFQLQQGENAMQNSAAAKGGLLSGRTMADLNNYAQGTASTNYQNVFNNALTQYQTAYQSFLNNQNNTYNRLMGASQLGEQATAAEGQFTQGMSGDIASLYGQMGATQAGGTMAMGQGLGGALSSLGQIPMLSNLMGGNTNSLFTDPGLNIMQPGYMPGGGGGGMSAPLDPFNLPQGAFGTPPTFGLPGYAMGTDFAPGGPSIVGEAGPEMVNLPRGSQVIPNYQLSSLAGGDRGPLPPIQGPFAGTPGSQRLPIGQPIQRLPIYGGSGAPGAPAMPFNPAWGAGPPRMLPFQALR